MMNEKIRILTKCLCCGNINLKEILDLNDQPLANSYLKQKTEIEEKFPLKLNFCSVCTHLQLSHVVNPNLLFKNYLYVSGTSQTLQNYFKYFVTLVQSYLNYSPNNILDIACNDGSQLDAFKEAGYNTFGIDPAENLFKLSSKNHNIVCDYINDESIKSFGVNFDVIIAQNVFAHNDYPNKFLDYCKQVLNKNGLMFIQTSQANMIKNNEFDTIYHEHISYFTARSFCVLAKKSGFNVIDIIKTDIHGTSFVFILSKSGKDNSDQLLKNQDQLDIIQMKNYANQCHFIIKELNCKINHFRTNGYKIVGYGAAAKGNTLLNFGNISLDYIVDDNPLKHNLYTPGMKIPIFPVKYLNEEFDKLLIIPLAWNFFDEIKNNLTLKSISATFIRYFPEIIIEK